MIVKDIDLGLDYEVLQFEHTTPVSLTGYILKNYYTFKPNFKSPAVIVCPGGAYMNISNHEGDPIALSFVAQGISAFVLRYSVAPARFPQQLVELCKSIEIIRMNADEWGIDPDKIFVCGFSAGGHLAASAGTLWNHPVLKEYGLKADLIKPAGMILGYPVISSDESYCHRGSFENLLGEKVNTDLINTVSLEKAVSADTVPAFMMHTFDDDAVPVENALNFALSLKKFNIPCELHVYPHGYHGIGLANDVTSWDESGVNPKINTWINFAIDWVKSL